MFLPKKKKNDWSKLEMEENILDISISLSLNGMNANLPIF